MWLGKYQKCWVLLFITGIGMFIYICCKLIIYNINNIYESKFYRCKLKDMQHKNIVTY